MKNLVPLPYRRVSVQPFDGELTEAAIVARLSDREAYRRTDFVVLRSGAATAVVQVTTGGQMTRPGEEEALFKPIESVEILAPPDRCVFVEDPGVDVGLPSALAAKAAEVGVGAEGTLVVRGRYEHVGFIHHPDPLVVRVVEVTPPDPPKLFDLAQRVLDYAHLPPIRLELEGIDLRQLAVDHPAAHYLVPGRSGGLDQLPGDVCFLDERPKRKDWTLIGCERSLEFHRHYYGDEPPRVEMCPRRLAGEGADPTLLKCCLLETEIELDGNVVVAPWGSDLELVEKALRQLAGSQAESRSE
jgi:hypothetical protein